MASSEAVAPSSVKDAAVAVPSFDVKSTVTFGSARTMSVISGASIVSIVISLPTVGPLLLQAILAQDMYLAGSLAMVLSSLGLFGTLISDLLLVAVDPRIRFTSGVHG